MAILVTTAGAAVLLVLVLVFVLVHRRPHRGIESHELSAYHDGLDALTRLEARRSDPSDGLPSTTVPKVGH